MKLTSARCSSTKDEPWLRDKRWLSVKHSSKTPLPHQSQEVTLVRESEQLLLQDQARDVVTRFAPSIALKVVMAPRLGGLPRETSEDLPGMDVATEAIVDSDL